MSECEHMDCHVCHRIVLPIVTESRMFITKYCPYCGTCLYDIAKPDEEERA